MAVEVVEKVMCHIGSVQHTMGTITANTPLAPHPALHCNTPRVDQGCVCGGGGAQCVAPPPSLSGSPVHPSSRSQSWVESTSLPMHFKKGFLHWVCCFKGPLVSLICYILGMGVSGCCYLTSHPIRPPARFSATGNNRMCTHTHTTAHTPHRLCVHVARAPADIADSIRIKAPRLGGTRHSTQHRVHIMCSSCPRDTASNTSLCCRLQRQACVAGFSFSGWCYVVLIESCSTSCGSNTLFKLCPPNP